MGQEVSTPDQSPQAIQNAPEDKFLMIETPSATVTKINSDIMDAIEFKRDLLELKDTKERVEVKMKAREQEYGEHLK